MRGKSLLLALIPMSGWAAPPDGAHFAVSVDAPPQAEVGKATKARVKLEPGSGYKINKEYPIRLEVTPPGGVTVDRPTQRAADAVRLDAEQALFDVAFTAKEGQGGPRLQRVHAQGLRDQEAAPRLCHRRPLT
jgi:hypothetical protein